MYCSSCGKENSDGKKFCKYCGNALIQISPVVKEETIDKTVEEVIDIQDDYFTNVKSQKDKKINYKKDNKKSIVAIAALSAGILVLAACLISFIIKDKNKENKITEDSVSEDAVIETVEEETEAEESYEVKNPDPMTPFELDDPNGIIYRKWIEKFSKGYIGYTDYGDNFEYCDDSSNWCFSLKDVNDDGIMELLLTGYYDIEYTNVDESYYDEHPEMQIGSWLVFSIIDGVCEQTSKSFVCYDTDGKNIYEAVFSEGAYLGIDHAENGVLTTIDEYVADSDVDGYLWYDKDRNEMSKEAAKEVINEFLRKQNEYPLDTKQLTPENLDEFMPVNEDIKASIEADNKQNETIGLLKAFLNGEARVRIGEGVSVGYFGTDINENNEIIYKYEGQEVALAELKNIIINDTLVENLNPEVYYSVINIDDRNIILLKLQNVGIEGGADDGTSSTFVIANRDGELVATYCFDDYARGGAEANKYGVIWSGGSSGAGHHGSSMSYIDGQTGEVRSIYRSETCSSGWIRGLFGYFKQGYFSQQTIDIADIYDNNSDAGIEVTLYEINDEIYGSFDSEMTGYSDMLSNSAISDGLKLYTVGDIERYAQSLGFEELELDVFFEKNGPEWYDMCNLYPLFDFYR